MGAGDAHGLHGTTRLSCTAQYKFLARSRTYAHLEDKTLPPASANSLRATAALLCMAPAREHLQRSWCGPGLVPAGCDSALPRTPQRLETATNARGRLLPPQGTVAGSASSSDPEPHGQRKHVSLESGHTRRDKCHARHARCVHSPTHEHADSAQN